MPQWLETLLTSGIPEEQNKNKNNNNYKFKKCKKIMKGLHTRFATEKQNTKINITIRLVLARSHIEIIRNPKDINTVQFRGRPLAFITISFFLKSAPIVALYAFENFLSTNRFKTDVCNQATLYHNRWWYKGECKYN